MTHRGHVRNGQITLDQPVRFPEGAKGEDLSDVLLRHTAHGKDLPNDLAEQHDFYAHGKPKQ